MDEVDALIARYRAVGPNRDGTLDGLLANLRDPRVPEFVLAIAANPQVDPWTRISVLRRFEHFTPPDPVLAQKLRKVFLDIVSDAPNPARPAKALDAVEAQQLVRSYAVSALGPQCHLKEVTDALVPILINPAEDSYVRVAAFHVVVKSAPWPEREPMVRALLNDEDLHKTARIELAYRNRK
jgi:hypothetical protein